MKNSTPVLLAIALEAVVISNSTATAAPSSRELAALAEWSERISGAVVYTHEREIHKVAIGDSFPVNLGAGEHARWSADGKRLAVYHRGSVYVMNADGTGRRKVADNVSRDDGSPVEFHTNGEEIIFWKKREGFFAVHLENGEVRKLNAPATYSGEPGISADGTRMAARWGNDLYLIDLINGTHRKYARGCSPGVSPSGQTVMNNIGNHRYMEIRDWDGLASLRSAQKPVFQRRSGTTIIGRITRTTLPLRGIIVESMSTFSTCVKTRACE